LIHTPKPKLAHHHVVAVEEMMEVGIFFGLFVRFCVDVGYSFGGRQR
jgi:hypothetical protein